MKKNRLLQKRNYRRRRPSLRFNPRAWAKLLFLRDRGETEIGGFGLSAADDPLAVIDILTVKQKCTPVTVAFDDAAVADLVDELVDQGIHPERFGRIWLHTHPGNCAEPSSTDEATFQRVFGRTEWSVMGIVARGGASYARLSFHTGPGGALKIPVRVDYGQPFAGSDWEEWGREYDRHVVAAPLFTPPLSREVDGAPFEFRFPELWDQEEELDDGVESPRSF